MAIRSMYSSFSLQGVRTISARTYPDLESAPLILSFEVDCATLDGGWSEITIHTESKELTAALVRAINDAVSASKESQASTLVF